jgi:hypothetical protein
LKIPAFAGDTERRARHAVENFMVQREKGFRMQLD